MSTRVGVNSNCPRCGKPTRSGYCRDCVGNSIWIDYEIQREFTDWADLCDRHNAEVDELQRRLDAVVKMLEPGDKPNHMDPKYNPASRISVYEADITLYDARLRNHARAVAIAEGRDNG